MDRGYSFPPDLSITKCASAADTSHLKGRAREGRSPVLNGARDPHPSNPMEKSLAVSHGRRTRPSSTAPARTPRFRNRGRVARRTAPGAARRAEPARAFDGALVSRRFTRRRSGAMPGPPGLVESGDIVQPPEAHGGRPDTRHAAMHPPRGET